MGAFYEMLCGGETEPPAPSPEGPVPAPEWPAPALRAGGRRPGPPSETCILVTGAGSGIGRATALRLAAAGRRVPAGARRDELIAYLDQALADTDG